MNQVPQLTNANAAVDPMNPTEAATYQRLRSHLAFLRLGAAAEALTGVLDAARAENLSLLAALERLLAVEAENTQARRLAGRMRFACLPTSWTLAQFDFAAQPGVDEQLIRELSSLRFLDDAGNILFIGPPGTGKTMLAIALARAAVEAGHRVYFTTAADLAKRCKHAAADGRCERCVAVGAALNVAGNGIRVGIGVGNGVRVGNGRGGARVANGASVPEQALIAVVGYGPIKLCATCATQRSTLGKAQTPTPLPDTPPVDVLHWVSTALADMHNAERQLAAAVHRARQHGHPWSTLGNLLGITRQAAQQRFRTTDVTVTKPAGGPQMNPT